MEIPLAFPGNSQGISGNAPADAFPEMPRAFPWHFPKGNAWKCAVNFPERTVEFPPMWKYSNKLCFFYGVFLCRCRQRAKWLVH